MWKASKYMTWRPQSGGAPPPVSRSPSDRFLRTFQMWAAAPCRSSSLPLPPKTPPLPAAHTAVRNASSRAAFDRASLLEASSMT